MCGREMWGVGKLGYRWVLWKRVGGNGEQRRMVTWMECLGGGNAKEGGGRKEGCHEMDPRRCPLQVGGSHVGGQRERCSAVGQYDC